MTDRFLDVAIALENKRLRTVIADSTIRFRIFRSQHKQTSQLIKRIGCMTSRATLREELHLGLLQFMPRRKRQA